MIEAGFGFRSELLGFARRLVRATEQRALPDAERLQGFAEADLPAIRARITSARPVYRNYEMARLRWSLARLREELGADHPFVRELIGQTSPDTIAQEIAENSKLDDPVVRTKLWNGGRRAVRKSTDPAIMLARIIEATALPLHRRWQVEVDAPLKLAAERLAKARFERYGASVYPDATFSLRASFGAVRGWTELGKTVPAFTTLEGLYARSTPHEPFKLASTWTDAKPRLDLTGKMNQVSDNDITGGNSGSPLIDQAGQIVGLIFDGNLHSLGGSYFYDGAVNRAVSVHPQAIVTALRDVYGAEALLDEMTIH